jgi:diaminopimelate decarboxylase
MLENNIKEIALNSFEEFEKIGLFLKDNSKYKLVRLNN